MQLLTSEQVARMFAISTKTLQKMRDAGHLPYVNMGAPGKRPMVRYKVADIEAILAATEPDGDPAPEEPVIDLPELPVPDRRAGNRSYVYFLQAGPMVKIGRSRNIKGRMNALQSGCPYPIRLVRVEGGGEATERRYHKRFRDYHERLEWFRLEGALLEFLAGQG